MWMLAFPINPDKWRITVLRFSPAIIVPPTLHTHLHLQRFSCQDKRAKSWEPSKKQRFFFQKPESFGQDRTFTFKLFSKGLIKSRVKFIRTFAYIEVKWHIDLDVVERSMLFSLFSIFKSRNADVWGYRVLCVCPSLYVPISAFDRFLYKMVWTIRHWGPSECHALSVLTVFHNNMAGTGTY